MSPRERTLRRMKQLGVAAASVAGASSLGCPKTEDERTIVPAEIIPFDASIIDAGLDAAAADANADADVIDASTRRKRMRDRDAGHSYAPRPPPSGYMVVDMLPPPPNRPYKP